MKQVEQKGTKRIPRNDVHFHKKLAHTSEEHYHTHSYNCVTNCIKNTGMCRNTQQVLAQICAVGSSDGENRQIKKNNIVRKVLTFFSKRQWQSGNFCSQTSANDVDEPKLVAFSDDIVTKMYPRKSINFISCKSFVRRNRQLFSLANFLYDTSFELETIVLDWNW